MIKNKDMTLLLVRLFLGYIFFSAGVCKLTNGQFGQLIGPPWMEEALAKHSLGLFAQVVAVSQAVCGALLLSQRFSLLGAIMLVPMNVAILAVTVSMNWVGTPYVNTVFLGLNLMLLLMERQKFSFLFKPTATHTIQPANTDQFGQNVYSWLGLGLSLLVMVAARYNITVTNVLALLAFTCFALTILASVRLAPVDKLLLTLPFVAMGIVTLADRNGISVPALLLVLAAETILLATRMVSAMQKNKAAAVAEGLAAGCPE